MDTEYVAETFQREDVSLDGSTFVDCTFLDCRLRYAGEQPMDLVGGTFERCDWTFEGAALNTLLFLQTLYHDGGDDGEGLLGAIVDELMAGDIVPSAPDPATDAAADPLQAEADAVDQVDPDATPATPATPAARLVSTLRRARTRVHAGATSLLRAPRAEIGSS